MSTSAFVGIVGDDGEIAAIYVSHDGAPEQLGATLITHYPTTATAAALVARGAARHVGPTLDACRFQMDPSDPRPTDCEHEGNLYTRGKVAGKVTSAYAAMLADANMGYGANFAYTFNLNQSGVWAGAERIGDQWAIVDVYAVNGQSMIDALTAAPSPTTTDAAPAPTAADGNGIAWSPPVVIELRNPAPARECFHCSRGNGRRPRRKG